MCVLRCRVWMKQGLFRKWLVVAGEQEHRAWGGKVIGGESWVAVKCEEKLRYLDLILLATVSSSDNSARN